MDEQNFEKKSSKKTLKITLVILLLLVIIGAVAAFTYKTITNKPDKVFEKAVSQMFEQTEKNQDIKTTKMTLDMSLVMNKYGNNLNSGMASQLQMINLALSTMSINAVLEMDLENQIFNEKLTAKYLGEDLVSIDGLIQNNKIYLYLNNLYSKYIEIPEKYLEGMDLASLFKKAEINQDLIRDIKEIFMTKIESSEFKTEDVEITLNDKEVKAKKSTLTLARPELIAIMSDVLAKVNQYENDKEVKELTSELIELIEDIDERTDNKLVIDIYTEGLANKIVRYDLSFVNEDDNEVIIIKIAQKENKVWEVTVSINEDSTSIEETKELFKIEITEENKNEGKIVVSAKLEDEGIEAKLNIGYNIENNVEIEKRNITNSITIDEFSEADLQEIYTNAQKNEMLKTIIDMVEGNMNRNLYLGE